MDLSPKANPAFRILTTDNGKHPPDKWAAFTADDLISVDGNSDKAAAGHRLKADIIDLLTKSFDAVQKTEMERLAADPGTQYASPITPEIDTVEEVVDAIVALADKTSFASFYQGPGRREAVTDVIRHHLALAIDIERSHHADQKPNDKASREFQRARTDHGIGRAHLHLAHLGRPKKDKAPATETKGF